LIEWKDRLGKIRNSNIEIRNKFEILMFKSIRLATHRFEHYDFYVLNIVSDFEFTYFDHRSEFRALNLQ